MTDETESVEETETLDNIFEDETPEETEAPETTETTEVTEETEEVTGEEPAPPADEEPTLVPIAAVHDYRRREKLLKDEISDLKSKVPQTDELPDPYEDLAAYDAAKEKQWEQKQFDKQQAQFKEKLETSKATMLEKHDDYLTHERTFMFMVQQDPTLTQQMVDSADPALFAYEKGKEYTMSQKEALRAEILAETSPETAPKPPAPSLATATAPTNTVQVETLDDLGDMFGDQDY